MSDYHDNLLKELAELQTRVNEDDKQLISRAIGCINRTAEGSKLITEDIICGYKYWRISHSADTTETGLPRARTYVRTSWAGFPAHNTNQDLILEDWCFQKYGPKVAYVQGVAPCPAWSISLIDKERFDKAEPINWGGYKTRTEKLTLEFQKGGKFVERPGNVEVCKCCGQEIKTPVDKLDQ